MTPSPFFPLQLITLEEIQEEGCNYNPPLADFWYILEHYGQEGRGKDIKGIR